MAQVCGKCSRANPDEASYCYYDGVVLGMPGANGGPLHTGTQAFPTPFVFPSGRTCRNFDQLAIAFQENWSEAADLLQQGFVEAFLGGLGRVDLAMAAKEAARFPDRDRGLDQLLAKLPSDVIEPPKMGVEPTEVNLGQLAVGEDRQLDLHLTNRGMRLLYGSAACADCVWLALGEAPGAPQKLFQFGSETVVPLYIRGKHLRAGNRPLEGRIVVESNGGSLKIRVRADVPVKPYPDGILAGAKSPREVAAKARDHPKEAAAFFENGAVARWYEANGWTYPVQGPAASGQGAVQQFFEALGLTRPPKVEINAKSIALQGAVGERVQRVLEVKTVERRPVYAYAVSDQPWLEVGRAKLNGRIATIPVVVPAIPDRGGETLQAKVTVTSNGNQTFEVPVTLEIAYSFNFDSAPASGMGADALPPLNAEPEPIAAPEEAPQQQEPPPLAPETPPAEPVQKPPEPPPLSPTRPARTFKLPKIQLQHALPALLLGCALLVVVLVDLLGSGTPTFVPPPPPLDEVIDTVPRISVNFNKDQGRFGISMTQEQDPARPNGLKGLTFHDAGNTNNACLKIDDRESLFGLLPGQWLRERNQYWKLVELKKDRRWKSIWQFPAEKILVTQLVEIVAGEQTRLLDTCLVSYEVANKDGKAHSVGLRVMLDTFIGANDGVPFLIPGQPALLETMKEFTQQEIPDFIQAQERADPQDPGTVALMGLKLQGVEPVDRMLICRWPGNSEIRWDIPMKPMNEDPMHKDSCVVLYWPYQKMNPGETRKMAFTYGLGTVTSTRGQLGLLAHGATHPDGEFTITVYVPKPAKDQKVMLHLAPELTLVGNQPDEKTIPAVESGKNAQVSWKVKAPGHVGEYPVTVTSGLAKEEFKVRIITKSIFD